MNALLPAVHPARRRLRVAFDALSPGRIGVDGLGRRINVTRVEVFRNRDWLPAFRERTLARAFARVVVALPQRVIEFPGGGGLGETERLKLGRLPPVPIIKQPE